MSILSRGVTNSSLSLKLNSGFNHVFRLTRSVKSTATDSTAETMGLDSESQEEDHG
jgi:hypothetical protein